MKILRNNFLAIYINIIKKNIYIKNFDDPPPKEIILFLPYAHHSYTVFQQHVFFLDINISNFRIFIFKSKISYNKFYKII